MRYRLLGRQLDDRLIGFESVKALNDERLRLLWMEIHDDSLLVGLKGAGEALRARIAANFQQGAAQLFDHTFEPRGAVPMTEVERAQNAVIPALRA